MNYKEFLKNDILPVWTEISHDAVNGGVFTSFDGEHTPNGDAKSLMSLGRSIWMFSVAYMHVEPKKEYLDICESIFRFLEKCTMQNGKLPLYVAGDGTTITVTERTFYAEMYCIMGCAQYYKATKVTDVKMYVEKLFDFVYEKYMSQKDASQEEEAHRKSKCFGVHMTALMMTQSLKDAGICCDKAEKITDLAISQMQESGFVDDEKMCVYEHAPLPGHKLSGMDAVYSCTGHVYEAAWFVMHEGELRDNTEILLFGKKLLDYALPQGFETVTEFIPTGFDTTRSVGENTVSGNFEAFPQQEAIIAYRLAYILFGEEKYRELAGRLEKSLHSYYERFDGIIWCGAIRTENGEYADIHDRGHYGSPFHLERYLLVLEILEKTTALCHV